MDEILDFTPITTAKIPPAHFARLCGASRASAHQWMRGTNPRGLYYTVVAKRLKAVKAALERGALPLPPTPRTKQFDALVSALKN